MTAVECPTCGATSAVVWRCEECGVDIPGETTTEGREEA